MIFKKKDSGFSLIELLVVISILAVLVSVVFTRVSQTRGRTRDALRAEDLKTLDQAVQSFIVENGRVPANLTEITNFFQVNTKDPLVSSRRVYAYVYDPTTKTYCLGARMEVKTNSTSCPVTLVGTFTTGTATYSVNYRITGP